MIVCNRLQDIDLANFIFPSSFSAHQAVAQILFHSTSRHANLRQQHLRGDDTLSAAIAVSQFAWLAVPTVILCINKVATVKLIGKTHGRSSKNV